MRINNHGNGNVIAHTIRESTINVRPADPLQELDIERRWTLIIPIRPSTLGIIGMLSFIMTGIGTVASCYSVLFGTVPNEWLRWLALFAARLGFGTILLMVASAVVAALGWQLARRRFAQLGSIAFEISGDGNVAMSALSAPCPRCAGRLRLRSGAEHDPHVYFTCSRNPGHCWRFDYTTL